MQSDLETTNNKTERGAHWPGAFAAYSKAYEGVAKNSKPAMLVVGLYLAITIIGSLAQGKMPNEDGYKGVETIVGLIFLLALPLYGLAIADKRTLSIKQFMKFDANKYFMVLFTSIICSFAVVLSLFALIIPVIWVLPWVYLALYASAEKGLSPVAAIKYSKSLAGEHKAKVWGLIGVGILLTICSFVFAVVPVVGMFLAYGALMFVSVLNNGANGMLYRFLQAEHKAAAPAKAE